MARDESDGEDSLHLTTSLPPGAISPDTGTVEPVVDPVVGTAPTRRSFRANSAARFLSDTYLLLTSLVAAAITARVLGPSGKGFYSTLTLLTVLLVQFFNLGLGEAAIVLVGKKGAQLRTASSATLMAIFPLSLIGALCFLALGWVVLQPETANERTAIAIGTILVFFNVGSTTLVWFLVLEERIALVAGLTAVSATVGTLALWFLVAQTDDGAAGAVAGSLIGCLVILAAVFVFLSGRELSLFPRWNLGYLKAAARFGVAVQMSNLLVQMTGRLDLVLVYRLADSASAGTYSIALTVGTLVGGVPIALAFASFPRIAQMDDAEGRAFTLQLFRMGLVAALGSAAVLAVLTPVLIPAIFGQQYVDSIAPTLILIGGGVLWSGQWVLARAAAARGHPKALFISFALSFVAMVALDFLLIGPLEGLGAAIASLAGSLVGFVVAASFYRGWQWRGFVPTVRDGAYAVRAARDLLASLVRRTRARP